MSNPGQELGTTTTNFLGMYLEEDYALKEKLTGLTVSDANKPARSVPVQFTLPQEELQEQDPTKRVGRTYPRASITFLEEAVASDREHRGTIHLGYVPYTDTAYHENPVPPQATPQAYTFYPPIPPRIGPDQSGVIPPGANGTYEIPWTNTLPSAEFPLPIDITYQVSFFTRSNVHIKQLKQQLNAWDRLHPRFAYLDCPGGTVRRIVVQDVRYDARWDPEAPSKRLFRMDYTLVVNSEILPSVSFGTRVQAIVIEETDMAGNPLQ